MTTAGTRKGPSTVPTGARRTAARSWAAGRSGRDGSASDEDGGEPTDRRRLARHHRSLSPPSRVDPRDPIGSRQRLAPEAGSASRGRAIGRRLVGGGGARHRDRVPMGRKAAPVSRSSAGVRPQQRQIGPVGRIYKNRPVLSSGLSKVNPAGLLLSLNCRGGCQGSRSGVDTFAPWEIPTPGKVATHIFPAMSGASCYHRGRLEGAFENVGQNRPGIGTPSTPLEGKA